MGKLLSGIASVVMGLVLSVAIVGCTGSSPTPTKDKMGGDKMMSSDKMGGDKMSTDKMGGEKMGGEKMKDNK
jgi:pentapeptide MXKDX repeat protein